MSSGEQPYMNIERRLSKGGELDLNDRSKDVEYRDAPFIVLPIIALVYVVAMCASFGKSLGQLDNKVLEQLIAYMCTCIGMGVMLGLIWVALMYYVRTVIVKVSLGLFVLAGTSLALFYFVKGESGLGAWCAVYTGAWICYFIIVRNRLPLIQALLETSLEAISDQKGSVLYSGLMTIIDAGWMVLVWYTYVFAYVDSSGFMLFLIVCASIYFSLVLQNIAVTTACGSIGAWWFSPGSEDPSTSAFMRTMTTSFGSVALGTLVTSVFRTIIYGIRTSLCCVRCLLSSFDYVLNFFSIYALASVALFGQTFMQSARSTYDLFEAKGFTALAGDGLVTHILDVGAFVAGVIGALVGLLWILATPELNDSDWKTAYNWIFAILGYWLTNWSARKFLVVIRACLAVTVVGWAADPAHLSQSRPEQFGRITQAADLVYGANWQSRAVSVPAAAVVPGQGQYFQPQQQPQAYAPPQGYVPAQAQPGYVPAQAPVALPPGWEARLDAASGRTYYINHTTKGTQWHHPVTGQ